jgi:hypothetical protein
MSSIIANMASVGSVVTTNSSNPSRASCCAAFARLQALRHHGIGGNDSCTSSTARQVLVYPKVAVIRTRGIKIIWATWRSNYSQIRRR